MTQETQIQSLGQEDLPEEGMATHSCSRAWKSYGQRSLAGYSSWSHKELDITAETEHAYIHIFKNGLELGNVESNKNTYSGWTKSPNLLHKYEHEENAGVEGGGWRSNMK